jgi:aspartyl-tRNA synthetase
MELIRSQISAEERHAKKYIEIKDIDDSLDGQEIRIRGRLHNSRAKGKQCFIVVRQAFATVQACLFAGDGISPGMVKYSGKIPRESIIEIVAKAVKPDQPINGASQQLEL